MNRRSLLVFPALALALSCDDARHPTGVQTVQRAPSEIILDGAHGGNPDFWFLPPMVPPPFSNPNFKLGTFNNALQPSLTVEICELEREPLILPGSPPPPAGLPTATTLCKRLSANPNVFAPPIKTFGPGTVNLVNLPLRQTGWWSRFNLPPDGFYYVLWNTRESNLDVNKYYRIKVLVAGSNAPLGVADVDPMSSLREWKHSLTGEVIQLIDDVLLPIPFRVEQGALCGGGDHCTSVSVPNSNPNGTKTVVAVEGGAGAIGGASFPNGWLRSGDQCPVGTPCPQSVVVTISEVPSGETESSRTRTTPCHVGLPLQQFNKCFRFTTTPELAVINGAQFALDVTVAVCYVLENSTDPRAEFAQLYSSGPGEVPHSLPEVDDTGILGPGARNCALGSPIGFRSSNPVTQFAFSGWSNVKRGFGKIFGVETAYALDAGLGGLVKRFSNIGPALTAEIQTFPARSGEGPVQLQLESGVAIARAKIVGTRVHRGEGAGAPQGINTVPVTFTVASGHGTLRPLNTEGGGGLSVAVMTAFLSSLEVDGIASVEWIPPSVPGTYEMTATGPTTNGPIAFSVTVPPVGAGIAAGVQSGCAILAGGVGSCWGANHRGQLGDGSEVVRVTTPVIVAGNHNFIDISVTNLTACGVTVAHAAYCWGYNAWGQLGNGTTVDSRVPVLVAGNHSFGSVATGFRLSCGLTNAGKAYCWGSVAGAGAGLGDGLTSASSVPIEVAHEGQFKSISVGLVHACALDMGGSAYCWGDNAFRGLGTGNALSQKAPTPVVGGHVFTSLVAGNTKTCGVKADGSAWCWGQNWYGEMGTGSVASSISLVPGQVVGNVVFRSVVPGAANDIFTATCGLSNSGDASCWGANYNGELGIGFSSPDCSGPQVPTLGCTGTPTAVQGGHVFREIAVGGEFVCGITVGRQVLCWGRNNFGQLGNTTTEPSTVPTPVATALPAR